MKLNPIAQNQTEIESPNGVIVFYSCSTPVAAFVPGQGGLCTEKKYNPTTTRHVNKAIARWGCGRTDVPQERIEEIANSPKA